jgi:hypothetical protein
MKICKHKSMNLDGLSSVCRENQTGHSLALPMVGRSKSLSDLILQLPASIVHSELSENMEGDSKQPKTKKPRRCHQCHTPVEEGLHSGVRTGVGVCTLPHWHACDGDIPEADEVKGQVWAPCPMEESSSDDTGPDEIKEVGTAESDPEVDLITKKSDVLPVTAKEQSSGADKLDETADTEISLDESCRERKCGSSSRSCYPGKEATETPKEAEESC